MQQGYSYCSASHALTSMLVLCSGANTPAASLHSPQCLSCLDKNHQLATANHMWCPHGIQVQGLMQQAYSYRSAYHALTSITSQQGLAGLMKGYWATNSVWFPWNMIYIACYEKSKQSLTQSLQARLPLPCAAQRTYLNICLAGLGCQFCLLWSMISIASSEQA